MRSARFDLVSVLILAALAYITPSAAAQHNTLDVGDEAPGLDIASWPKGAEVAIEPGRTYVVLFFSTEERKSGLMFLQFSKMHAAGADNGLIVLGISEDEAEAVEGFVLGAGNQITFPIGVDNRAATSRNWYNATEHKELPVVFIVDKRGVIQYIGKPSDKKFPEVLELVLHHSTCWRRRG